MPDFDKSRLPQPTAAKSVSYWFDDNTADMKKSNTLSGRLTIDGAELRGGLHTLHYLLTDTNDATSSVGSSLFFKINAYTESSAKKTIRYWFDENSEAVGNMDVTGNVATIDAASLRDGVHTFHCQVIAADTSYAVSSAIFMKISNTAEAFKASKLAYWFDSETSVKKADIKSGIQTLDASGLKAGLHTLHYQIVNDLGLNTPTVSALFMKIDRNLDEALKVSKLSYWFDSQTTVKETAITSGIHTLDASGLTAGLHTLHYQIVNGIGMETPPTSALFMKLDDTVSEQATTVTVWFDEDYAKAKQLPVTGLTKIVDAKDMAEGPHTLHYQLQSANGKVFPICSAAFERCFFDIYIKESTEYNAETIASDSVFADNPDLKMHYSSDNTAVRGRLTVDAGTTLSLGKYVQTGNLGNYNNNVATKFTKNGDAYYHPTTLINEGFMRSDSVKVTENFYHNRWHFISLPFNVAVSDISMPANTYCALRRYNGEARATGNMDATWQNMKAGDTMEAGRGYILQLTRDTNENVSSLTFKAENDAHKNDIFVADDAKVSLDEHVSEFAHNHSWNLVGNPYPSFFDTRFIEQGGTITVWNGNGYSAYSLTDDSYVLMPFEAFFIQKPINESSITFAATGRQHTHEVREIAAARLRRAELHENRQILNITVSNDSQTDRTRIVVNERATTGYEDDKDAPKFFTDESMSRAIQLYSIENGVKYAINERPMGNGYATLSLLVPDGGDYTLQVDGNGELIGKMAILDTVTGTTWSAADGPLTFFATAGQHDGRFVLAFNGKTTGIGQQRLSDEGEICVTDGQLNIHLARESSVSVFATDGRLVYSMKGTNGSVKLESGIYLLKVDKKTTKIIVK